MSEDIKHKSRMIVSERGIAYFASGNDRVIKSRIRLRLGSNSGAVDDYFGRYSNLKKQHTGRLEEPVIPKIPNSESLAPCASCPYRKHQRVLREPTRMVMEFTIFVELY